MTLNFPEISLHPVILILTDTKVALCCQEINKNQILHMKM